MTFIKSISGFRGTIGGKAGDNLTPQDVVACTAAYGQWLLGRGLPPRVVIGRDARRSGELISQLVSSTLRAMGIDVIDLGLSTTPTVEVAVPLENAGGGIILTASHNPEQWNALKLLNEKGEFISAEDGRTVLQLLADGQIEYADVDHLGTYVQKDGYIQRHVEMILDLPYVQAEAIRARKYKVVVDPVNSTGALAVPALLEALGCEVVLINGEPNGFFAHNPEPLPEHLTDLAQQVVLQKAHLGISVDPDVDRLALVCEDGSMFGEEYTLVAAADYVLQHKPGNTVSNLSSTRALRDITLQRGGQHYASAVGEVNVVQKMKEVGAVIGGEGNGGVILPDLHYGRDALVGIALILSALAQSGRSLSALRARYPNYYMSKGKIQLEGLDVDAILDWLKHKYAHARLDTTDGLKIDLDEGWIHLRKSNTEPIVRIYTESTSEVLADRLADKVRSDIQEFLRNNQ